MSLLFDVGEAGECCTNHALEAFYKAAGDPPSDRPDDSIWQPHDNPLLQGPVEEFSHFGSSKLGLTGKELLEWLMQKVSAKVAEKAPHPLLKEQKWSASQLAAVKGYLDALPKGEYSIDDWMLVVEYLVQKNLPAEKMLSEAEWYAAKTSLMGPIQANLDKLNAGQALAISHQLPHSIDTVLSDVPGLTVAQQAALQWAKARCCDNVVQLTHAARSRMKQLIVAHHEEVFTNAPKVSGESLQTKLFDLFGTLNRDWRRIAITEAGENQTQGLIACLPAGSKVKRVEQYRGTCAFCRKIDGAVMTVVSPDQANKDGTSEVWVGKNNIGRSAAPSKRVGNALTPREPAERWWVPAGLVHPHCRGRWVVLQSAQLAGNAAFAEWVKSLYEQMR